MSATTTDGPGGDRSADRPIRRQEEIMGSNTTDRSASAGLIIRQKDPTNLETPFDQLDSFLTPTELFYIRSHFSAPKLDLAAYRLRIGGAVRNPCSLSYQEL